MQARETICKYYAERNTSISPEQIILTSSSSEAYSLLFRLLCNVGDEILVPKPSYPLFDYLADINDVLIKHYRLEYDGNWNIDVKNIQKNLFPNAKAIILVNPNNPTGSFVSNEEREKIYSIASERQLAIIEDEVFADFRFSMFGLKLNTPSSFEHQPLSFLLNGISKTLALPQMKLGWIIVEGDEVRKHEALQRLEILTDTYLSVNTPIQNALPKLFSLRKEIQEEIVQRVKTNYQFLQQTLLNSPCSILNAEGGWSAILRIPNTKSDEQFAIELLEQENVLVYPGHFFDFDNEGYFVLSLLPKCATFSAGIMCIAHFFSSHK